MAGSLALISRGFVIANYLEAALWAALALAIVVIQVRAMHRSSADVLGARPRRRTATFAAILLIVFGLSDVVETQTGAWWRPWWLLVWKSACVLGLVACFILWRRLRTDRSNE